MDILSEIKEKREIQLQKEKKLYKKWRFEIIKINIHYSSIM